MRDLDERWSAGANSRGELLKNPRHWPLFYHTVWNMSSSQLVGVLERTLRQKAVPLLPVDFDDRYERAVPDTLAVNPEPVRGALERLRGSLSSAEREQHANLVEGLRNGDVRFLNTTVTVDGGQGPAWFHPRLEDEPALWSLKLHGFEFLDWFVFSEETLESSHEARARAREWIRDWDRSTETDIGVEGYLRGAWTPHAVSLRVLNLSRYYAWSLRDPPSDAFLELVRKLIYKNALFLANHIEYDVGGNHLIENAAGLSMAGTLFEDDDTFLETGIDIFESAESQFLEDGGHYERSPMYHLLTLARYLTVLDLLDESGRRRPDSLLAVTERATRFAAAIRPPDGRIPLCNDAVFDEAFRLDSVLEYARAVGIESSETDRPALPNSGYFWLGDGSDRMLVDGGPFGPADLPAHSHNDFFALLLWVDGHRLLTDTGTYHYAPSPRRQYSRSAAAHNTAQVGRTEPVPIGGQYLAGRRVHPHVRYVERGDLTVFEGEYDRYALPNSTYRLRRCIYSAEDWWVVRDSVESDDSLTLRQRLHLHPQVTLGDHPESSEGFSLLVEGTPLAHVLPMDCAVTTETESPYFPEFGLEEVRTSLVFETPSDTERLTFLLSKEPSEIDEVERLLSSLGEEYERTVPTPNSDV